jgi:hypothetical protein
MRRLIAAGLALTMLTTLVGASPAGLRRADAQGRTAVLTAVGIDGALRALDGGRWVDVLSDVAHGATVTDLAWHPSRPEVLIVRRKGDMADSVHSLVRLDLATGTEEIILDGVGPEARILGPRFAPDGRSAFARLECCLSRQMVRFGVPPADTAPTQGPARAFLHGAGADDSLVAVGPYAADGRILMSVSCCMLEEVPPDDPTGLYLVRPDLSDGERIASGVEGFPLGLGPSGAWVAYLDESAGVGSSASLAILDLPGGTPRIVVPPMDPPLANLGDVAPDGRIAVAQQRTSNSTWGDLSDLWIVEAGGSRLNVTNGAQPRPTAFAWADPDVVSKARVLAAVIGPAPTPVPPAPAPVRPQASTNTGQVQVYFSRHPESDGDFTAVFPVERRVATGRDVVVIQLAIQALIFGPDEAERAAGYFSELGEMLKSTSHCGGGDNVVDVIVGLEDGLATVRFCRFSGSAGVGQDARVQSAIEATLRQFTSVQRVRLLSRNGNCMFDMSGENRCLSN